MNVQDTTVTRGDSVKIGHSQYYTSGKFPTATEITVNGEHFLEIGTKLYTHCGWCEFGIKSWYRGVYGGVCFQCDGRGYGREVGTVEAAAKIARTRQTTRARRARKAAEKAAAEAQAGIAWRAANSELADMLDAIYAELAEAGDMSNHDASYAAQEAVRLAWGEFVLQMANTVGMGRPLTEKQTAAAPEAIEEALVAAIAEQARQDASRHFGQVGDKVIATGTVVVAMPIEVPSFNGYGTDHKMLVIIEGTGEFTGVTFKIFGTGKTLWETERDQAVEVKGTVKAHGEREGIKQTELTRCKVTPVA